MDNVYKSPLRKLVSFFKKSRDSWKDKFQKLKVNYRNLERRHEYGSNKIKQLKGEVKELKKEINLLQTENSNKINSKKRQTTSSPRRYLRERPAIVD